MSEYAKVSRVLVSFSHRAGYAAAMTARQDLKKWRMPPGWRGLDSFSEIAAAASSFNEGRGVSAGHVYFLAAPDGLIKIGYSAKLHSRLRAIKNTSPVALTLLASIPGSKATEQQFHNRFASSRAHGEWFQPSPDLISVIAEASAR